MATISEGADVHTLIVMFTVDPRRLPNVFLRDDPNGRRRLRVCLGSRRVFIRHPPRRE
jgi:hypothetical protein